MAVGERRGEPSEEVVLVNPVLDEEDEDEDGCGPRDEEAVEGNNESIYDVEWVHGCVVKFWEFEYFVKLELEEVDWFVLSILVSVVEAH